MNYVKSNIDNKQDMQDWIYDHKNELDSFIEAKVKEYIDNSFSQDLNNIILEEAYLKFVLPTHIGFVRDVLWNYIDRVRKEMEFQQ